MPQFNEGNINSYLVPSGSLTGSLSNSGTLTGQIAIGSGSGTTDYNDLTNKPQINSVTLSGNKTTSDLNISYNDLDDKPVIPAAQVNSDWNAESGVAEILNKPTIPTELDELSDVDTTGASNGLVLTYRNGTWEPKPLPQDLPPDVEDLSNFESTPAMTTGQVLKMSHGAPVTKWTNGFVSYNELTDRPTIPAAQVNSDWAAESGIAQILNKPLLATVATSGSYDDLTDKPTIPDISIEDISSNITVTKSSGEWSFNSVVLKRSGNTYSLTLSLKGSGNVVNAGSNAFVGTISGTGRPTNAVTSATYISSAGIIYLISGNGDIYVRVIGSNATLASGGANSVTFVYVQ